MITTRYCPHCGAANGEMSPHCFSCGLELGKEAELEPGRVGELLNGRYRLEAIVGTGGFSIVYRALDTQANQCVVAVKQINLQGRTPEDVIEATDTFNRETALLAELSHPQIPQLFDAFGDREHWYLVLEFLKGETLEALLEQYAIRRRSLPLEEILTIGQQLCIVLEYLHTRRPSIIFRDLKPGNILRTAGGKFYLIDFGIARRYKPGKAHDTQRLGSPGYAAPEQYGRAQTTYQADIYSLGVLLHQLLTGEDPSLRPRDVAPRLPTRTLENVDLIALIESMLSPNPRERPHSVRNVGQVLESIRLHQQTFYRSSSIWQPPVPQPLPTEPLPVMSGTQMHIHAPAAPARPVAARKFSRRRVMIGLGIAGTAAAGYGLWQMGSLHESHPLPAAVQPAQAASPEPFFYTYYGHHDTVKRVAWSPDGKRIASCSLDKTVQIWPRLDDEPGIMYTQHTGAVNDVTWSPDGLRVASCSQDKTVQIYDANAFTIRDSMLVYQGHSASVNSVSWSPKGKLLASSSDDKTVQIWDPLTKTTFFTYKVHKAPVRRAVWSPDGSLIASVDDNGELHIWQPYKDFPDEIYQGHDGPINDVAWSPDSMLIATAGHDATVQVWQTGGGLRLLDSAHSGPIYGVAWSPDGKQFASTDGNMILIYEYGSRLSETRVYARHTKFTYTLAWSPDGKYIVSGSEDTTVQVWSADTDYSP